MKKDSKRVFIDSAPLIYFLDEDEKYGKLVEKIIDDALKNGRDIVISPITAMEYLVVPYRENRYDRIMAFYDFINEAEIEICNIDIETAEKSAQIRSEYRSFKNLDAIQLACAIENGCDTFLTNDKQLLQFKEIDIEYLSDSV